MSERSTATLGAMLGILLAVSGCSDGPEPAGIDAAALAPDDATAAMNARQMDGPVWEAILKPLNAHVGPRAVTGKAVLTMDEGALTVRLDVKGVVAGQLHAQHIHGHDGEATCPGPQADADGDGVVSVGEGVPDYGPVLVPLAPFPTPDGNRYHFEETFEGQGDLEPARRAIVVHGAFVDGDYVVSLPVACGTLARVR